MLNINNRDIKNTEQFLLLASLDNDFVFCSPFLFLAYHFLSKYLFTIWQPPQPLSTFASHSVSSFYLVAVIPIIYIILLFHN